MRRATEVSTTNHRRWWIAGLLAVATALNYLDRQSFPVVVGEIKKEIPISTSRGFPTLPRGWEVSPGAGLVAGCCVAGFRSTPRARSRSVLQHR
jgi:hypothetical protein